MSARRKAAAPPPAPVAPEFRAEAHRRLDAILDKCPGTSTVLIAVDGASGLEATSVPDAMPVKEGMARGLFVLINMGVM
jgi:hypothetical protein